MKTKTVFVYINGVADQASFDKDIYIPFDVDEIILKSYTIADYSTGNAKMAVLKTNLVPDSILLSTCMAQDATVFVNSIFQVPSIRINGTYNFYWTKFNNEPLTDISNFLTDIILQFMFVQY